MAMDLWRPFIESKAGNLLEKMKTATQNQIVFADFAKQLIGALQSDLGENSEGGEEGEGDDGTSQQTEDEQERNSKLILHRERRSQMEMTHNHRNGR